MKRFENRAMKLGISLITYSFSKILLDGSHLSNNEVYCSTVNMGDVNSYCAVEIM